MNSCKQKAHIAESVLFYMINLRCRQAERVKFKEEAAGTEKNSSKDKLV